MSNSYDAIVIGGGHNGLVSAAYLARSGAKVVQFVRYEVGAGIEKKQDDFVNEVMAQVKANT